MRPARPLLRPSALAIVLIAVVLALAGCASYGGSSGGKRGGPLEDVAWVLTSYSSAGNMTTPPSGAMADLAFKQGQVSGRVVNSYSGPYQTASSGGLTMGPIASTQMAGPPELMALEQAYFTDLGKTVSYYSDGTTLTLYDADGAELLRFKKGTTALTGRTWHATAIGDAKT